MNCNDRGYTDGKSHHVSNGHYINDILKIILADPFDATCNTIFVFSMVHIRPMFNFEFFFCRCIHCCGIVITIELSYHVFSIVGMTIKSLFMHTFHISQIIFIGSGAYNRGTITLGWVITKGTLAWDFEVVICIWFVFTYEVIESAWIFIVSWVTFEITFFFNFNLITLIISLSNSSHIGAYRTLNQRVGVVICKS